MVQGRRPESPGGTRSSGMVLAAVLLMVMVTQTRGKSQLSIVEDISKSLDNIFRDVQSLQQYIAPTTTPRGTTLGGASTPEISSETSTEFSDSTSMTTDVDSSSSDFSDVPTDTTDTTIHTSTTVETTTAESSSSSTTPNPTSSTITTIVSTTTAVPTVSTTAVHTTTTAVPTTTTDVPTTTTAVSTTTTAVSTTTTADPTTTTAVPTTTTPDPGGPKPRDRVKRRNLLSLATLDDALRAWVDPRIAWLTDEMSTETSDMTSDMTSDITSSEYTMATSIAATTPVTDVYRLDAALNEVDQVVTQVAAGTITEDQVGQMQAAEAEVKDVTDDPDEALRAELLTNPTFIDDRIERIKNDQDIISETLDKLKKHNTSVIVGSVLGSLLFIVLVAVGAVCYRRHMKKKKNRRRATGRKMSQSASGSAQQQMVELGSSLDEFPPPSTMPPNPLIPRANLDNFSLSSAQRNVAQESTRIPDHEPSTQVGEMRTEPGIENPGYVEEIPPRPVVPPKPRKRPSTFDKFGLVPNQMTTDQEPSEAPFEPPKQDHYIDELNLRLSPREKQVRPKGGIYDFPNRSSPSERQVRPKGEIYDFPMEPNRRLSRDPSLRHHQRHQHPRDHRMRHRNDRHVRRPPSVPPPDYTIPRNRHQSPDKFIDRKHSSQKQQPQRSPYEFEAPRRPTAPPMSEAPRPERNRSDIRRPYGPEDLY